MAKFILCALCVLLLAACKSTTTSVNTPNDNSSDTNSILSHALFEQNGSPSLNGWVFHPAGTDDTLDFEQDAPPGDGRWSYKLHTSDFPPATNTLTRNFIGLSSGVYSLTAWEHLKYILPDSIFPEGWISISKISGGDTVTKKLPTIDSTSWTSITLVDSLTLAPIDTVILLLSAGARTSNQHGNPVWFDDITFQKMH